jgi:AAA+ superfamily predicted ATPase
MGMSRQFKILFFSLVVTVNCAYAMDAEGVERLRAQAAALSSGEEQLFGISEDSTDDADLTAEMHYICQSAPMDVQTIIKHLKDPSFLRDGEYRSAIFYGPPGTGKTTCAKAIAYIMKREAGWEINFFSCSNFLGDQRNQGALRLDAKLHEISLRKKPNIVVIDELNQLLEHAQSSNHDTDATSKALWTFLDQQNNNDHFFLIGTMNKIDALPQQLKSRWISDCIEFTSVDIAYKNKIFRDNCNGSGFALADEIDDHFLSEQLCHVQDNTYRSLKKFVSRVKRVYRKRCSESSSELVITKLDIEQAVKDYQVTLKALKYGAVEETDAQRQERHFAQHQLMNSITQARQTTDYKYVNFINGPCVKSTHQKLQPADVAEIRGLFTPEQKAFVDDALARAALARQAELDRIAQATPARTMPARNNDCAVQ